MSRPGPVLLALLLAFPLLAQSPESCATSPAMIEAAHALDRFVARNAPHVQSSTVTPAATGDGFVILNADDVNTPFNRRFDLSGRSLSFALQSDGSYVASNVALQFDSDPGTPLVYSSQRYTPYTLTRFALPFFDRNVTQLYVARNGAIFMTEPPQTLIARYDALEVAGLEIGTIAPLLHLQYLGDSNDLNVNVKELDDRAVFTWSGGTTRFQATLFRSGDILYSYDHVDASTESAIVLSKGALPRHSLASHDDASNDVAAIPALPQAVAAALDIRSVTVSRLADLDLLEVRLTTARALEFGDVPESYFAAFEVSFGAARLQYMVYGEGFDDAYLPVRSMTFGTTSAARVEGSTIVFRIDQDYLVLDPGAVTVTARTAYNTSAESADSFSFALDLPAAAHSYEHDFTNGARGEELLVEAFTTPSLNPFGAWRQLKARYGLSDENVDAVAFYPNFETDLRATAYSTVGNAGADGVWMNGYSTSARPKSPALLHMNTLGRTSQSVLLHELGHRWLFWIDFIDNSTRSSALNLLSHPAEQVHTGAAFGDGTSPLGGRYWVDNGNGTFTWQPRPRNGFSWIELYLMGLAAPSEVQLFYVDGWNPGSGDTVTATRKDVTAEQVIAAIGPRNPAYPNAQKTFNVLFVLVADPSRPVTQSELRTMSDTARAFPESFRHATGARGTASLLKPQSQPAPPRRRSVRH